MKLRNYIGILFLTLITHAVFSQVIPATRKTNWTIAGYNGTIPVYSLVRNIIDYGGNANGIAANDIALQNAIASLNNQNGIIFFPAGSFLFNAPVSLQSGIVLRGEGASNTTLQFNLGGNFNLVNIFSNPSSVISNVSSTVLKGDSVLPVDNSALFHAGDYIKLYQNDAALVNDSWALESVGQIIHIDSIKNSSIYFSHPLRRNYLLITQPKIRRLEMLSGIGIECLKIKRMDATPSQTSNIRFTNAVNCWVKGVESDSCNFAHVQLSGCSNIEITNSYFHGAFAYGTGGQGYGVSCENTSGECLIENNIFQHLRHSMLVQSGANGNVFAYNYSLRPFRSDTIPNDLSGDIVLHGNYPYMNLFEGNIVQNIIVDASHGINGPFNTFFRNRAELYGIIIAPASGDSTNIVGNEISGTGFQQGNYILYGSGNFEYGNNKNNIIIPAGSEALTEKSLFYNSTPGFWNSISLWPSIGAGNAIRSGTIPAKDRLNTATTFCLATQPVIYTFTGNGNWNVSTNWSNNLVPPPILSDGSEIKIDPPVGQKCILNIPYVLTPGIKLTVRPGKQFEVMANLTFVK